MTSIFNISKKPAFFFKRHGPCHHGWRHRKHLNDEVDWPNLHTFVWCWQIPRLCPLHLEAFFRLSMAFQPLQSLHHNHCITSGHGADLNLEIRKNANSKCQFCSGSVGKLALHSSSLIIRWTSVMAVMALHAPERQICRNSPRCLVSSSLLHAAAAE